MKKLIPLFKPHMPELPELHNIINSGFLASGKYTNDFENKLKDYFETNSLIVASSYHISILIAITALDIKYGDEIIASPMGCLASIQPYLSYGLKIIWADVNPETGTLSPESVEKKITKNTKAIIHNHYCGYPGDIDSINEIGKKYNIPVIDDGIECFGSIYKNKKIGNCGTDITVFSFNAVRIPNTIDGGCVIFKDENLYRKALLIRDCGIDRGNFRDANGEINPNCDISIIGYSGTMSNVNGYIGSKQMNCIDNIIQKQRINASKLEQVLKDRNDIKILSSNYSKPNYWIFGVLAENKEKFMNEMRLRGLTASSVHINNNIYSVFGDKVYLPGVDKFISKFVALPSGWWIDDYEF